jgi:hypothetical protein
MTTNTDSLSATDKGSHSPPARVSLSPANAARGLLDGAWWPRSRDLSRELPVLTDAMDRDWGRITRVTVNPQFWPVIPRKVHVGGHVVKVGWFTDEQDPHKLVLMCEAVGRRDLLVVPPETGDAAAARLMSAAADPLHSLTATGFMAEEAARSTSETDRAMEEDWESEGGPLPPSHGIPETPTGLPRHRATGA